MKRVPNVLVGFVLGFATLLVIFVLSSDFAAQYEVCETTKEGAKQCASYGVVHFTLREIGAALDAYNGLITAIATIFIAWFTFSLRKSTDRLWDAGERQIALATESSAAQSRDMQASTAAAREANELNRQNFEQLNRPYVFVFGVKNIEVGPTEHLDALVPYFVANHGQTPALIDRVEYCLSVGNQPGDTGAAWDDHPLVVSPVLGIGEKITATASSVQWLDSGHRITDFENSKSYVIPEIKVRGTIWYFWVKIFYRGPFSFGHESSACWSYDLETCQFVQFGGIEYNYTN